MRECRYCGHLNPESVRVCAYCSKPLPAANRAARPVSAPRSSAPKQLPNRQSVIANRKRCPKCGAVISANAPRCPRCRLSFARKKKGLDWRLVCVIAAVLVIGTLIVVLAGGKRDASVKDAQPVSVVDRTAVSPSPAFVTETPQALEEALSADNAFAALQLSQEAAAVTVYDAAGNGKRVSRVDAAAYLTALVASGADIDASNIDIVYDDDTQWSVELTLTSSGTELGQLLAQSNEDIYHQYSNNVVRLVKTAMQTYAGSSASVSVNWLSSETGGLVLRLWVPAVNDYDELGDDPEHPQLYRSEEDDDLEGVFEEDLQWSDDLSESANKKSRPK